MLFLLELTFHVKELFIVCLHVPNVSPTFTVVGSCWDKVDKTVHYTLNFTILSLMINPSHLSYKLAISIIILKVFSPFKEVLTRNNETYLCKLILKKVNNSILIRLTVHIFCHNKINKTFFLITQIWTFFLTTQFLGLHLEKGYIWSSYFRSLS